MSKETDRRIAQAEKTAADLKSQGMHFEAQVITDLVKSTKALHFGIKRYAEEHRMMKANPLSEMDHSEDAIPYGRNPRRDEVNGGY